MPLLVGPSDSNVLAPGAGSLWDHLLQYFYTMMSSSLSTLQDYLFIYCQFKIQIWLSQTRTGTNHYQINVVPNKCRQIKEQQNGQINLETDQDLRLIFLDRLLKLMINCIHGPYTAPFLCIVPSTMVNSQLSGGRATFFHATIFCAEQGCLLHRHLESAICQQKLEGCHRLTDRSRSAVIGRRELLNALAVSISGEGVILQTIFQGKKTN